MMLTERSSQTSSVLSTWRGAFAQRIQEFPLTPLEIVSGRIPSGLRGSLYRNGPALFTRRGERIGHWFDGDGAVLGVHFDGTMAIGTYRMVQTKGYQAEEALDRFKFGGYGRRGSAPFWDKSVNLPKNVANISVLAVSDRLLALWEGGKPHALDLHTLETFGLDYLQGSHSQNKQTQDEHFQGLEQGATFSAHPKIDPHIGDIYNFGLKYGRKTELCLYRCDRTGKVRQRGSISLKQVPLIHDFVLAGPYILFFISPVQMNPLPMLLNLKSSSDSLRWRPERGTEIWVVDRETLTPIKQGEAEPWFQWHFGNSFVHEDGHVMVDVVRYEDFKTNQFLQEVPSGQTQTAAAGKLWQLRVDPTTATVKDAVVLSDRTCDFPTVNPHQMGRPSRYTYVAARADRTPVTEFLDELACYDHRSGEMTLANLGNQRYPSEPIFAPDPQHPDQGWVLSVVYDGDRHTSEVWIFQSQALSAGPICRLALPQVIAHSFHGTWSTAV